MISLAEIKSFFNGRITLNQSLAQYTTFRIGGPADYFLEPADEQDIINILKYADKNKIPHYIMGNGSNVLISDSGIRGIVLNLESAFSYLKIDKEKNIVVAGAGVKMAKFVDFCINHNLAGVEMLAGIPATIGGALVMNAGCYGGETADCVVNVKVIKNFEIKLLSKNECGFAYRNSNLKNSVVLHGEFQLNNGNQELLNQKRKEFIIHRNQHQPVEIPNAGCIFKNPPNNKAAILIDKCGLKGVSVGGASVSYKHANFIVNQNNASANDVIQLIKKVKHTVFQQTGINLELEIKPIGFEELDL